MAARVAAGILAASVTVAGGVYGYRYYNDYYYKREFNKIKGKDNFLQNIHDSSVQEHESTVAEQPEFVKKMRRILIRQVQGKALELGVGTGANLQYYKAGVDLTVVDHSKEMLKHFVKHNKCRLEDIKSVQADVHSLPFDDDSFDYVVSSFLICSVTDPQQVLQEMSRVCKPDGKIFLLEHGLCETRRGKTRAKWTYYSDLYCRGCYNDRDMAAIVEESGLKVENFKRAMSGCLYVYVLNPVIAST